MSQSDPDSKLRAFASLASTSPDAAIYREVLAAESLDLTALYTAQDLVGDEDQDADLRLLIFALLFAISEGGLCLRIDDESALAAILTRMAPGYDRAGRRAAALIDFVRSDAFRSHALVAVPAPHAADHASPGDHREAAAEFRPLIYEVEAGFLYFQKHFAYKRSVARQVAAFFAQPVVVSNHGDSKGPDLPESLSNSLSNSVLDNLRQCLDDVFEARPVRRADGQPLQMAAAQQLAILLGLLAAPSVTGHDSERRGGFLIVTGGPGTGKTSTVLNLLRALLRQGADPAQIALAAPTGRAARRMTESLQNGLASIAEPAPEDLALNALRGATLHQLLRFQPSRNRFAHDASNPLVLDALVVDEVSMVDAALMSHLLEAVDVSRTLVVFLGDRDQLPSVEAGAVLADFLRLLAPEDQPPSYSREVLKLAGQTLANFDERAAGVFQAVESPSDISAGDVGRHSDAAARVSVSHRLTNRIVQLTESFRSGNAILNAAFAINAGDADAVLSPEVLPELEPPSAAQDDGRLAQAWPDAGCYRIVAPAGSPDAAREAVVLDWIREHFDGEYLELVRSAARSAGEAADNDQIVRAVFKHVNRSRILAIHRRGRSGVAGVNRIAGRWLENRMRRSVRERRGILTYYPGLPILITRNDHRRELYNGDVGVVLSIRTAGGAGLRAFFERPGGRFASFPIAVLPEHDAAFALTVHKSQGSEYNRVLILLPDDPEHRLLSREVLYTGLTRAKDLAVLCGPTDALSTAVRRRLSRETGSLYAF
ncbi:MAG: exodeoxyribonuclease V subunit alpha [bacterium]|nr:exodeoxyribonuclease V subunit alpha [bacterium]